LSKEEGTKKDHVNVANEEDNSVDIAFMSHILGGQVAAKNFFIGNSGASCHLMGSDRGLFDWKDVNDDIIIGDGKSIHAKKIGKIKMLLKQNNRTECIVTLTDVKYVPSLGPYNLFSINQALGKGFKLGSEGKSITLSKGIFKMEFDKIIETKTNWSARVEMIPILETDMPAVPTNIGKMCENMNTLRELFGYIREDATKWTADYHMIKRGGNLDPCESCV